MQSIGKNRISPAGRGESARHGFTLIEIMVVVALIALLAGILLAVGIGVVRSSSQRKSKTTMQALVSAMSMYLKDHPEPGVSATVMPPYPLNDPVKAPYNLKSNDWVIKLMANPETAKLLEGLKPVGTGAGRVIQDGYGNTIYYLPSNLDLAATTAPDSPIYNTVNPTPGRFVSFGPDGKPDTRAMGGPATPAAAGDDIYSDGVSVGQ